MKQLQAFLAGQAVAFAEGTLWDHGEPPLLPPAVGRLERAMALAGHLLALGSQLCSGPATPRELRNRLYLAHAETARLVAPVGTGLHAAVQLLASLQGRCLGDPRDEVDTWCSWSPDRHLRRAFWSLCGLLEILTAPHRTARHYTARHRTARHCTARPEPRPGRRPPATLEEHCAAFANSLVLTGVTGRVIEPPP